MFEIFFIGKNGEFMLLSGKSWEKFWNMELHFLFFLHKNKLNICLFRPLFDIYSGKFLIFNTKVLVSQETVWEIALASKEINTFPALMIICNKPDIHIKCRGGWPSKSLFLRTCIPIFLSKYLGKLLQQGRARVATQTAKLIDHTKFIHTTRMLQPIWIDDTQNIQK